MYIDELPEAIEKHPRFGPLMREALTLERRIVLNYHHHGDASNWCVSVCSLDDSNPLKILDQEDPLEELAHIKGFGTGEGECVPKCLSLGEALKKHFELDEAPEIYLQGKPYPTIN